MNFTGTQRMSMAVRTKFHDRFLVKCKKKSEEKTSAEWPVISGYSALSSLGGCISHAGV